MNSTTADILLLAFGSFGILIALTVVGEILRARQPVHEANPVLDTYMTRVQSWWGMVAFVGIALLLGKIGVMVLFAFASFASILLRPHTLFSILPSSHSPRRGLLKRRAYRIVVVAWGGRIVFFSAFASCRFALHPLFLLLERLEDCYS